MKPAGDPAGAWPDPRSRETAFAEFKRGHPDASYAEFWAQTVLRSVREGRPHTTIGPQLESVVDWRESGRGSAKVLSRLAGLTHDSRVIDYGCGTFRIGVHLIEYLRPGNYLGLDVSQELLDLGLTMLGEDVLIARRPGAAVIDEDAISMGAVFGADLVFSMAVATHVHPREAATYFANLQRLAAKPGAVLLVEVAISDDPPPGRSLVLRLPDYVRALAPLEFVAAHGEKEKLEDGHALRLATLEFRRVAAHPASGAR